MYGLVQKSVSRICRICDGSRAWQLLFIVILADDGFFYWCLTYFIQESQNCPLSGAVSLCNPFDLVIADEDFRKGFNNVYDKALANGLREIFKRWNYARRLPFPVIKTLSSIASNSKMAFQQFHLNRHLLLFEDMGGEYNIPLAAKARTVKDFDEALTRGMRITSIPMLILCPGSSSFYVHSKNNAPEKIEQLTRLLFCSFFRFQVSWWLLFSFKQFWFY